MTHSKNTKKVNERSGIKHNIFYECYAVLVKGIRLYLIIYSNKHSSEVL